jgi:hypothetical protein
MTDHRGDAHHRVSGYDLANNVCWNWRNPGDTFYRRDRWHSSRCECPAHCAPVADRRAMLFGRCRSGGRWFWAVHARTLAKVPAPSFGWADSEEAATTAAIEAVLSLRCGLPTIASFVARCASDILKELNAAKRRARSPSGGVDPGSVEYLYNRSGSKFQIIRKTAKRIYYARRALPVKEQADAPQIQDLDDSIAFINRAVIERQREIWSHKRGGWWEADCRLYLTPSSES